MSLDSQLLMVTLSRIQDWLKTEAVNLPVHLRGTVGQRVNALFHRFLMLTHFLLSHYTYDRQPSRKRKRGSTSTPHQKKTKNGTPSTPCTPAVSKQALLSTPSPSVLSGSLAKKMSSSASKAAVSLARFQMNSSPVPKASAADGEGVGTYTHERLEWLKEDKRK